MAGSIAGALIRGSGKPKVPRAPMVDPDQVQQQTIQGNLAALGGAAQLGGKTQAALTDQWLANLERLFPGYGGFSQQIMQNLTAAAKGQLPADVEDYIDREGAERGIFRGTSGGGKSQFDDYSRLRDLGLRSLQRTDFSLAAGERWMSANRGPFFDFTNMFYSPQQRVQIQQWNEVMRYNQQWLKNQIDVIPEAWEQALANLFDNIEETGQAVLTSYAGGAMGGGAGAGSSYNAAANTAMNRPLTIPQGWTGY